MTFSAHPLYCTANSSLSSNLHANYMMNSNLSLRGFSVEAKSLVVQAQKLADSNRHPLCEPAHLLATVVSVPEITLLLKELEIDTVTFNCQLYGYLHAFARGSDTSSISPSFVSLVNRVTTACGERLVTIFDLFLGLLQEPQGITANLCKSFTLTAERVQTTPSLSALKRRDLNSCSKLTSLTDRAKDNKLDQIIGRDAEIRRLIQILGRRSKNHPLLVGEHGVGKRTVVLALAQRIIDGTVPKALKNYQIVQLNVSALLAEGKNGREIIASLREALQYLRGTSSILYIRSLESLFSAPALNLNDFFGTLFEIPHLQVITACTAQGLKKLNEREPNLSKEFTLLNVEPCSAHSAVEVLRGVAKRYENHHAIRIGEAQINLAVRLAKRYVQDRLLPESAIDLLDEAASNKKMEVTGVPLALDKSMNRLASLRAQIGGLSGVEDPESIRARAELQAEIDSLTGTVDSELEIYNSTPEEESESETILTEEAIAQVLSDWTNIPATKFLQGDTDRFKDIGTQLSSKVIDQTEAVEAVALAIRRSGAGLRDPKKPIGSFLFFGSSGVGKTLLAKAIAEVLFDSEENMLRLDCSELRESHTAAKLIGSPPGYQGSEQGGLLTEYVSKKPYCVVLLDEVEKAHPDIFNLLLQVLDDGRLTDSKGKFVDFSNTLIICTSNIGSKKILDSDVEEFGTADGIAAIRGRITADINGFFRPEFLNRIDNQVIFKPLTHESLKVIHDVEVGKLQKMLANRRIKLSVAKAVKQLIVEESYHPAFGARPLQRAITNRIKNPLVEFMTNFSKKDDYSIHVSLGDSNTIVLS